MGLTTAGLAFKLTSSTPAEQEMIRRIFGHEFHGIPNSQKIDNWDIRHPEDVCVESKNGVVFIYNAEVADRILRRKERIEPSFMLALGNPAVLVAFAHFSSGDTYGYTIIENGERTRSRIFVFDRTSDEGEPKNFELSWANAEHLEPEAEGDIPEFRNRETEEVATDAGVTIFMLEAVMQFYFGGSPWDDWTYRTQMSNYRKEIQASTSGFRRAISRVLEWSRA